MCQTHMWLSFHFEWNYHKTDVMDLESLICQTLRLNELLEQ